MLYFRRWKRKKNAKFTMLWFKFSNSFFSDLSCELIKPTMLFVAVLQLAKKNLFFRVNLLFRPFTRRAHIVQSLSKKINNNFWAHFTFPRESLALCPTLFSSSLFTPMTGCMKWKEREIKKWDAWENSSAVRDFNRCSLIVIWCHNIENSHAHFSLLRYWARHRDVS